MHIMRSSHILLPPAAPKYINLDYQSPAHGHTYDFIIFECQHPHCTHIFKAVSRLLFSIYEIFHAANCLIINLIANAMGNPKRMRKYRLN